MFSRENFDKQQTTVLVVAAHPDDEVLGCGGAIAKHAQQGDNVHILILAEGATSRDEKRDRSHFQRELSALASAAKQASEILGSTSVSLKDFPDNRMDGCELLDIVKVIEDAVTHIHPQIVYTHHNGDVNIDHRRVHEAVITACRPKPGSSIKTLLFFEVPSSTEWRPPGSAPSFAPNWFVDISETLTLKLKALEAYSLEMCPYPHPRSIESVEYLARWRGSTVGVEAAEAFMLGRNLCL
ncbi:PIG-L deacetylase family protein [Anabaena sp. 54]|uniref:PIG-L family deacetylase n=2 Tax=Dolichospermum flosaquae TaxID=1166 RepID=A0ACC7S3B1_DOLFA|nr:PIG-L deacetylase family protein [Anabaena sp. 54]MBO1063874.1 PIG-L family deacetylase [Anabaena sp. 54]MTJ42501.1 PIG-L family deacetylase [Dolichospermum flos-aquae UHCC 0037]